jgi:hypothetical protein
MAGDLEALETIGGSPLFGGLPGETIRLIQSRSKKI